MRQASIDLLRTAAIALMVLVHFLENLAGAVWTPAGFGAPLFAFLAGVSFRIWVRSQEAKGRSETDIRKVGVRRGLFLIGLGFAFNFHVWLPGDLYNWDVLTMTGTALVVLPFVRNLPAELLAFAGGMAVLISPFLRIQADYDAHWANWYYEHDGTLGDILSGYLATGYFPLFPWLVFPLAGYLAGKVVFPDPDESDGPPSVRPLMLWGVTFVAISVLLRVVRPVLPDPIPTTLVKGWTMFPASWEYVSGVLGMALLLFGGLHVLVDRRRKLDRVPVLLGVAKTMSRHTLSIYLLHHVLHIWPLWVVGVLTGNEVTRLWRNALPMDAAMALVPVCLLVCFAVFRVAERREWPTTETLMRWLCD